jgi:D-alanyl-D-alanine carboxypeptidase
MSRLKRLIHEIHRRSLWRHGHLDGTAKVTWIRMVPGRCSVLVTSVLLCSTLACRTSQRTDAGDSGSRDDRLTEAEVLQSQIERLREDADVPGIVVALAEGGGAPLVAATGYADIKRKTPLQPDTPFFIGSISKNLFATIALQLVEEGLLGLDDPLSTYVEWPRGDEITIRMLMNHTSGIPDYFATLSLLSSQEDVPEFFSRPRPPSEIIEMMPSHEPTFDPGSLQSYSNTNGLLVGEVIETVTGKSLGEVFEERIVSQLGLKNTYLYGAETIDRPRAKGYCGMPGWVSEPGQLADCSFGDEALPNSADGSIVASAADLLRYHQALRGGKLLGDASWQSMRRVEPGLANGLGYLIMKGPQGDHEGNVGRSIGHLSASVYYLERDLFVVMMLNQGDAQLPMRRFLELRYGLD